MVKLRQSGNSWKFYSETEMERFIWGHLAQLLKLTPLKQQHFVQGQFCDILAVSHDKQLVIIELKNEEDRYVVQQLTRYHHALLQEKPYQDKVDYSKPIRLLAIAPSFHRDNLIDRQYNHLSIEFLSFEIMSNDAQIKLKLTDLETKQGRYIEIPYEPQDEAHTIPPVPRPLSTCLTNLKGNIQERVLSIRQTLLSFDERVKETVQPTHILYGKGKNCPCAELRFGPNKKSLYAFLWLPHPSRKRIGRMLIHTTNWVVVERLDYYPKGMSIGDAGVSYWNNPIQMVKAFREWESERNSYGALNYQKLLKHPRRANSLDLFIEVALDCWVNRLS